MIKVFDEKCSANVLVEDNGTDITDTFISSNYPSAARKKFLGRISYKFDDVSDCLNTITEWNDDADKKRTACIEFTGFSL